MADTPLPQRCASCTEILSVTTNSVMLCAICPVYLKAETFPRVSVPSEWIYGVTCPYLEPLSCGESWVLSVCFGSSAPLPPRLLRHLYRDTGGDTAHAQLCHASCSEMSFSFRHFEQVTQKISQMLNKLYSSPHNFYVWNK